MLRTQSSSFNQLTSQLDETLDLVRDGLKVSEVDVPVAAKVKDVQPFLQDDVLTEIMKVTSPLPIFTTSCARPPLSLSGLKRSLNLHICSDDVVSKKK